MWLSIVVPYEWQVLVWCKGDSASHLTDLLSQVCTATRVENTEPVKHAYTLYISLSFG